METNTRRTKGGRAEAEQAFLEKALQQEREEMLMEMKRKKKSKLDYIKSTDWMFTSTTNEETLEQYANYF